MYKILRYIIFGSLIILFFASTFGVGFLSEYSETLLSLKTNLIDKSPPELFFLWNTFIFGIILYLFRNF